MRRVIRQFKRAWQVRTWLLLILMIAILVSVLVVVFDKYHWKTGWNDQVVKVSPDEEYIPGKTLWDWLDLLIIPAMLALGAWWVNHISQQNEQTRAENENWIERQIASERNQEAALQNYLDRMTELLLKEDLRTSEPEAEVRTVARTRTLTVLRGLGPELKGSVVQFLVEAGLATANQDKEEIPEPIVSLQGVNLSGTNLSGTNLSGTNLRGADLREANLNGAILFRADLGGTNLREAKLYRTILWKTNLKKAFLRRANLREANLVRSNLREVKLSEANLFGADLRGANLSGANLRGADLREANLRGAILIDVSLPDGSKWAKETDMSQFTDPESDWNKAIQY